MTELFTNVNFISGQGGKNLIHRFLVSVWLKLVILFLCLSDSFQFLFKFTGHAFLVLLLLAYKEGLP